MKYITIAYRGYIYQIPKDVWEKYARKLTKIK